MGESLQARIRKLGVGGVALAVLALVACELPLVLVAVGLVGAANVLRLPAGVEAAALVAGVVGVVLIAGSIFMRRNLRKSS